MRIHIKHDLMDLESLGGAVVVLDVFRASNTIIAMLAAGAAGVRLFSNLEDAFEYRRRHPDHVLCGERKGLTVPGCDGGNSPVAAADLGLSGRTAILTTSAGTQAVHRLALARAVFYGSFANASALVSAIRRLDPDEAHFLPMGRETVTPAAEDDAAAEFLAAGLAGDFPDFEPVRRALLNCDGAARLRDLNQQDDLEFCLRCDSHGLVPWVDPAAGFAAPLARSWPA